MVAGGLAVLLVPLQVSRMWRHGDRPKHVYLGWALVPIIVAATWTTPPIAFNMTQPFWSKLGFALGAVVWLGALVMGIHAIKTKQLDRHRRSIVMMASLSFGAVSFRIQYTLFRLFIDKEIIFPYIGWTCWVPNVIGVACW